MTSSEKKRGGRAYAVLSGLLMLLVLVGFSQTYYLRSFSDRSALSGALQIHGAVLTAWFALLLTQTLLVRSRNVQIHRRLGVAGAIVAVGVVVASAWILALRDAPHVEVAPGRGFGNLMSLVAFSLCTGTGLVLRRSAADHRRMMLIGSMLIVAPAISRILYRPIGSSGPGTAVALFSLLLTVVVLDLVERRRPHRATLAALALVFLLAPAITFLLIETGLWPAFVRRFA